MLAEFLEKALAIASDSIEIEYKDGKEWVTAFSDCVGYGIGCLKSNSDESRAVFKDLEILRKRREVGIGGTRYRLIFSERDSFGETLYRIEMKEMKPATSSSTSRQPYKR